MELTINNDMTEQLQKKVDRAIKILQAYNDPDNPVEVAYSGGKDSDVILQLAKEAGINYRAIYKNTTIDPPGTIGHVREMGVEKVNPKEGFFKLMETHGIPSRFYRFCCQKLKEYHYQSGMHKTIIGVRRSESKKRAKRYKEPTECLGTKKDPNEAIYPILDWDDKDVREFILDRGIKCAPVYYDDKGNFHVERRLGCMCCPLQSKKKRLEDFKAHPKVLKQYIKRADIYIQTHPDSNVAGYYGKDVYRWMVSELFFENSIKRMKEYEHNFFGVIDYKKYLEDYFGIEL